MKNTENQLPTDVETLQKLLLEAQSLLLEKEAEISSLLEQLKLVRHQIFSPTSEKQSPQQGELFDEAEHIVISEPDEEEATVEAHSKTDKPSRKRGRSTLPAHLPRVEVIHDLAEVDKICPHDGT
ncbi:transposase, partial [Psychromonas antarctica]|uniref:transposase n=1 Tax=Psychromonas antarctica TaxID=67573 RepID=UPI001EE7EAFF